MIPTDGELIRRNIRRKAKPLSQHDVDEIVKFQEHLADKETMQRDEFYRKYQLHSDWHFVTGTENPPDEMEMPNAKS